MDNINAPIIENGIDLNKNPIFPNDDISEEMNKDIIYVSNLDEIAGFNFKIEEKIKYDINRVSSKSAKKSGLGPYKTSFLRKIIQSHKMGKSNGTKNDLVSTILEFYEKKTH